MSKSKYGTELVHDVLQWDISAWTFALELWQSFLPAGGSLRCLELGSNRGGLALWLARQGHHVVCSDLEFPGKEAVDLHKKHDVAHLVTYQAIDATGIPFQNEFDVIIFKSILGGIGRNDNIGLQQQTMLQAYKALKTGGRLLFAENIAASTLHQFARKHFVQWGAQWRYPSISEIENFVQPFSSFETKCSGFLSAFGRTESQRTWLARADKLLFNQLISDSGKYILAGAAVK